MQHPSWCDRTECTATGLPGGGLHWSPRAVLDPDPRTDISATVRIGQGTPVPGHPGSGPTLVDLTVHMPALDPTDTDADYLILMEGERAVLLGEMLVAAGRVAGRSGNPVAGPANLAGMERAVRTTAPGDPGDASR